MEKEQPPSKKLSLLATLAPFLCFLPLNTASLFIKNSSFISSAFPFDEKKSIVFEIIAEILIILISYKYFHLYKKISIKSIIFCEILLTFVLCVTEMITETERVTSRFRSSTSWFRLSLFPVCLFIYCLLWPIFKLKSQLYLHRCSEKSNRKVVYTIAICIQMLPNVYAQTIIKFVLDGGALMLFRPFFCFIFGLVASFALFILCYVMDYFGPKSFVREIEDMELSEGEEKKTLKDVLSRREFLYLFVICTFVGTNENKLQTFVNLKDYPKGESVFLFWFENEASFLTFSLVKVGLVAWVFDKLSKRKMLNILMTVLFGFAVLYYHLLISKSERDRLLVVIFGKQDISELIHLAVQFLISEKFNGSPEVFFLSNAFFSLGDLLKIIADPIVLGGRIFFLQLFFIQALFLVAYFLSSPKELDNQPPKKLKLG